jgi:hypothetical protein
MNVFVSIDSDDAGKLVGRMSLADDPDGLRRISRVIESGNKLWTDWALNCAGEVISAGGDEARLSVPASAIGQIPPVAKQYYELTGFTVTVGIGTHISQADKALLVGKIQGKNCIRFYEEADEQILLNVKEKSEEDKLAQEYLTKYEPVDQAGRLVTALPQKPKDTAANLDETGQVLNTQVQSAKKQPPEVEGSHSNKDFIRLFHNHAMLQQNEDNAPIVAHNGNLESLKQQVAGVLESVKQQIPVLEELQQAAPDTYEAVMNLTQAVIDLARELKDQDLQKSEELMKFASVMPLPKPHYKKRPTLPAGTALGFKVKVKHADGTTSWVNVKDGQVQSTTEANPASARYPDAYGR